MMKWGAARRLPALRLPGIRIFFGEFGHSKPWSITVCGRSKRVYQMGSVCVIITRRARHAD